jgi:CubicO group peptidase (beta-lactamase class C family)
MSGSLRSAARARARRLDPAAGLDEYVEKAMRDWEVPGVAVAVVKDDRVDVRGFGVREAGKTERVDENTVFAMGSNTKAVTALALGLLVQEGKVGWDDPAVKWLPELELYDPCVTRELTLRDMLSHRAGYQTWAGDLLWYGSDRDTEQVLAGLRRLKPAMGFRTGYGYSNLLYLAAGEVICRASGTPWAEFVAERIFRPLGMTRTSTSVAALREMDGVATPHTRLDGRVVTVPHRVLDNGAAATAVNSSARDWAKWLRLQLDEGRYEGRQVVDGAVTRETWQPHTILRVTADSRRLFPATHFKAYGLGWFLRDYHGRLMVMHSGEIDGMLSRTGFFPEERLGVTVFTNCDHQNLFTALFYDVLDRYLGLPERDWSRVYLDRRDQGGSAPDPEAGRAPDTRPTLPLEHYAGTYADELLGEARVTVEDGRLEVRVLRNPCIAGPLTHWRNDTFQAAGPDRYLGKCLVTFTLAPDATVAGFQPHLRRDFFDPLEYVFRRTGG